MVAERVFRHLPVLEAHRRNALEDSHQLFRRVCVKFIFGFQPGLEVHHKVSINQTQHNITLPHFDLQELFQSPVGEIILVKGGLG